jgi:aspartyl-tRNA synthetase
MGREGEKDRLQPQPLFHAPGRAGGAGGGGVENGRPHRGHSGLKAYQYDIVCNGVELSSGAIRNHRPDIMFRAFEIAGYSAADVERGFSGMLNAFRYGAPPHGGIAPGIDRIVMLLAEVENLREVTLFPMNQQAEDLMMGAPAEVPAHALREVHIRAVLPEPEKKALIAPYTP